MSEKEKKTLEALLKASIELDVVSQAYMLGYAQAMIELKAGA